MSNMEIWLFLFALLVLLFCVLVLSRAIKQQNKFHKIFTEILQEEHMKHAQREYERGYSAGYNFSQSLMVEGESSEIERKAEVPRVWSERDSNKPI